MDDLGQVLRDLNGKAMSHRVTYYTDPDDGRAYEAEVFAGWLHARFQWRVGWHLVKGSYDRRPETLTGLLNSIREA